MEYIKEITVELSGEMYFDYITAVQGDLKSRYVKVNLLENGQPYEIPEDTKAVLRCKKPDHNHVFNDAVIEESAVIGELTAQMLAVPGNARCEISLYSTVDESVLTTVPFIVKVTAAAVDPNVTSTNEYTALASALLKVEAVSGISDAALETATEALEMINEIEEAIGEHTAAADAAADRANLAAEQAEAVVEDAGKLVTRYGVRFGGNSNTGATVTRLYNAVGLVANVGTDSETAVNDFDNIYPWAGRRRCCGYFDENGIFVVNAYKGEPGYTTDGSNGEVWVETPLFYYKHTYGDDGSEEIVISSYALAGYSPAPMFIKQDGSIANKAYTAAYRMAIIDGKATSRSGVFPTIHSLNTAITDARTLGNDYTVTTAAEHYSKCLLMWVEFATRNMQSVMTGASSMPYVASDKAVFTEADTNRVILPNDKADRFVLGQTIIIGKTIGTSGVANNRVVLNIEKYDEDNKAIIFDGDAVNITANDIIASSAWKTGSCDGVLSSSGSRVSNTSSKYDCMYRGEEGAYSGGYEFISDVLIKQVGGGEGVPLEYEVYHLPDPRKYNAGTITDDYIKLNYQLPLTEGYPVKLGKDTRYPGVRLPETIGATSTTRYSDYYYKPGTATVCAARFGGYWFSGAHAGPTCWICTYSPSYVSLNCRARLSKTR